MLAYNLKKKFHILNHQRFHIQNKICKHMVHPFRDNNNLMNSDKKLYGYYNHLGIYNHIPYDYIFLFLVMCYALSYWQDIPLLTPLLGILMMCSGCLLVARRLPGLFSSFSEYIFQIYLMSMIFQAFVELILWKRLFYNETLFPLFYILNVAAGIFLPVLVAKVMERCPWRWLRLCFGLK